MPESIPTVYIVEDDVSVREALEGLISNAGWQVSTFASAREFLSAPRTAVPSCLILDLLLPDLNGLGLQVRVVDIPIIFITGDDDAAVRVQAMKSGAIDFLTKPFTDTALLDAVRLALDRSNASSYPLRELSGLK